MLNNCNFQPNTEPTIASAAGGGSVFSTTVTAAGTTTLNSSSNIIQEFTGTNTQIVREPDTTTLTLGKQFQILNKSTLGITVQSSAGAAINTLTTNTAGVYTCVNIGADGAASWDYFVSGISLATLTNWTESTNTYLSQVGVKFLATNAGTNVDAIIQPKGTGAFYLGGYADGSSANGNNRGSNAIDLQTARNSASFVASGSLSVCVGNYSTASGTSSVAIGSSALASGTSAKSFSENSSASGTYSSNLGGYQTLSNKLNQTVFGYSTRGQGYNQYSTLSAYGQSSSTTNVEIFLDGAGARLTLANSQVFAFQITAVSHATADYSKTCRLARTGTIYQVGSAASTAISAVSTLGTDVTTSANLGVITLTADTSNGSLKIQVNSGETATLNWTIKIDIVEVLL